MNISDELRNYFVYPSGGFAPLPETHGYVTYKAVTKSREDPDNGTSTAPDGWIIEGASFGVEWWAIPAFLAPAYPALIDVHVPDQMHWPPELWDVLDARDTVHQSGSRAAQLGFATHLRTALTLWSRRTPDFADLYRQLPLRSRIVLREVHADPSHMQFEMIPSNLTHQYMLTSEELHALWGIDLPPTVEVTDLVAGKRLADAVVKVKFDPKTLQDLALVDQQQGWVMKCADAYTLNDIYHEIRTLLTLSPHPNVAGKPPVLVTMQSPDTGKALVCGFVQKYYRGGTLNTTLPMKLLRSTLSTSQQLSWAKGITAGLIHFVKTEHLFLPDLKTDNVILDVREGGETPVLIDYEMGRNLYNWAPPEIYYVEWMAELSNLDITPVKNAHIDPEVRQRADDICTRYMDAKRNTDLPSRTARYSNPPLGYYYPWLLCSEREREAAEVYLLGRMLWCIFEGVADGNNVLGRSHAYETEQMFPEFRRTPPSMQALIKRCTAGAREWTDGPMSIVRVGGQIFPRGMTGNNGEPTATLEDSAKAVHAFWQNEIVKAEAFLDARIRWESGSGNAEDERLLHYLRRPTLNSVLQTLTQFGDELGS